MNVSKKEKRKKERKYKKARFKQTLRDSVDFESEESSWIFV